MVILEEIGVRGGGVSKQIFIAQSRNSSDFKTRSTTKKYTLSLLTLRSQGGCFIPFVQLMVY